MIILKNNIYSAAGFVVYFIQFLAVNIFYLPIQSSTSIYALPITSKPIESTAENLAWQAWVMLPPEQKNQEKSKKVTPKSIFTLPIRDCPNGYKQLETRCNNDCQPGQLVQSRCVIDCPIGYKDENTRCIVDCPPGYKVYEFSCISLFSIDPNDLLTQELGLIAGNTDNIYDYEDDEVVLYEPPQKLSGEGGQTIAESYDSSAQLPTRDEPLKFNIFEQKFPTDYGSEGTAIDEEMLDFDNSNQTMYDEAFLSAINIIPQDKHINFTNSNNTSLKSVNKTKDMQAEGSDIFASLSTETSTTELLPSPTINDAISMSASSVPSLLASKQNPANNFVAHDDSSVQIISANITPHKNNVGSTQLTELNQLLKVDNLLPLNNETFKALNNTITTTLSSYISSDETTNILLNEQDNYDATTKVIPFEDGELTTLPITSSEIEKTQMNVEKTQAVEDDNKKNEHIRSIAALKTLAAESMRAQENEFTTTIEPDSTTNIQLDETTIIEAYDPPTIILRELESKHPLTKSAIKHQIEGETYVVKKSKVEPAEVLTESAKPTTTITTPTAVTMSTAISTQANTHLYSYTPLSSVSPKLSQQDDRFYYKHLPDTTVNEETNKQQQVAVTKNIIDRRSSNDLYIEDITKPPTFKTTKPAAFNIQEELRIINELVKGKRKETTTKTPATNNVSTMPITAESNITSDTSVININNVNNISLSETKKTNTNLTSASTNAETVIIIETTEYQNASTSTSSNVKNTPTTEATYSLWSKIIPILSSRSTLASTTTIPTTITEDSNHLNSLSSYSGLAESSTPSSSSSSSTSYIETSSLNSIRSNRNSKKNRLDKLNQKSEANDHFSEATITTTIISTTMMPVTTPSTTLELEKTFSSSTETIPSESSDENFEPFWWLPIGWRLDKNQNKKSDDTPFYLRFWSSLPGSSTRNSSSSNISSRSISSIKSSSSSRSSSSIQKPK